MINLIILGLSSCFILFGSTLLYVNTGITHLDGIYILYNLIDYSLISLDIIKENTIKIQEMNLIQAFNISFIILSVGYLFKVSSAPFHFWSPVKWFRKSLIWVILSNSRETLKFLVPNHYIDLIKIMCGWISYSCTVISLKISVKIMGNRGSKSVVCNNIIVKEQREYDSRQEKYILSLRRSLTGFERNYPVKILSNQLPYRENLRFYSSLTTEQSQIKLNPQFITGFTDGEGCFSIVI